MGYRFRKIISAITLAAFLITSVPADILAGQNSSTLAPWLRLHNGSVKKLIYCALHVPRLMYAESTTASDLLNRYCADALLLQNGSYLIDKAVFGNDEAIINIFSERNMEDILKAADADPAVSRSLINLTRAVLHENIEKLMRVIAATDRSRYSAIKSYVMSQKSITDAYALYMSEAPGRRIPSGDLLVNDIVASAFELILLRNAGVVHEGELSAAESALVKAAEPVFAERKHSYFTGEFWDEAELNKAVTKSLHIGYAGPIAAHPKAARAKSAPKTDDGPKTLKEKISALNKDLQFKMPDSFEDRFATYYILRLSLIKAADQDSADDFRLHYRQMLALLGELAKDMKTAKDSTIAEFAEKIVASDLFPDYVLGKPYETTLARERVLAIRKELAGLTTLEFDLKMQRIIDDTIDGVVDELYDEASKRASMKRELASDIKTYHFANLIPIDSLEEDFSIHRESYRNKLIAMSTALGAYACKIAGEDLILTHAFRDGPMTRSSLVHEIFHYLADRGEIKMPPEAESITFTAQFLDAIIRAPSGEKENVLSGIERDTRLPFFRKLLDRGMELGSKGEVGFKVLPGIAGERAEYFSLKGLLLEAQIIYKDNGINPDELNDPYHAQMAIAAILTGQLLGLHEKDGSKPLRLLKDFFNDLARRCARPTPEFLAWINSDGGLLSELKRYASYLFAKRMEFVRKAEGLWSYEDKSELRGVIHYVETDLYPRPTDGKDANDLEGRKAAVRERALAQLILAVSRELYGRHELAERTLAGWKERPEIRLLWDGALTANTVYSALGRNQARNKDRDDRERYKGAGLWIAKLLKDRYQIGNPIIERSLLTSLPLHMQYLDSLLYRWVFYEKSRKDLADPRLVSEKVKEAIALTQGDSKDPGWEALMFHPGLYKDDEIAAIIRDKLLPAYERLYQEAMKQAERKAAHERMVREEKAEAAKKAIDQFTEEEIDKIDQYLGGLSEKERQGLKESAKEALENALKEYMGQSQGNDMPFMDEAPKEPGEGAQEAQGGQGMQGTGRTSQGAGQGKGSPQEDLSGSMTSLRERIEALEKNIDKLSDNLKEAESKSSGAGAISKGVQDATGSARRDMAEGIDGLSKDIQKDVNTSLQNGRDIEQDSSRIRDEVADASKDLSQEKAAQDARRNSKELADNGAGLKERLERLQEESNRLKSLAEKLKATVSGTETDESHVRAQSDGISDTIKSMKDIIGDIKKREGDIEGAVSRLEKDLAAIESMTREGAKGQGASGKGQGKEGKEGKAKAKDKGKGSAKKGTPKTDIPDITPTDNTLEGLADIARKCGSDLPEDLQPQAEAKTRHRLFDDKFFEGLSQEDAERERLREPLTAREQRLYDEWMGETKKISDSMSQDLRMRLNIPTVGIDLETGQWTGPKLKDLVNGMMGLPAFAKRHEREPRHVKITLLVDRSGSMEGDPIRYAALTVFTLLNVIFNLNEELDELGFDPIEFEVGLFTTDDKMSKELQISHQTISEKPYVCRERLIYNIMKKIEAGGGTDDVSALGRAVTRMIESPDRTQERSHRIFISIGDANLGTDANASDIRAVIKKAKDNDIHIFGVSVGDDEARKHMRKIYGPENSVLPKSLADLPRDIMAKISECIPMPRRTAGISSYLTSLIPYAAPFVIGFDLAMRAASKLMLSADLKNGPKTRDLKKIDEYRHFYVERSAGKEYLVFIKEGVPERRWERGPGGAHVPLKSIPDIDANEELVLEILNAQAIFGKDHLVELVGETGLGKGEVLRAAARLLNEEYYFVAGNEDMEVEELSETRSLGSVKPGVSGYEPSIIAQVLHNGGWIVLDERHKIPQKVLNELKTHLSGKNHVWNEKDAAGNVVKKTLPNHPRARIFSTINPHRAGIASASGFLDQAMQRRVRRIEFTWLPPSEEIKMQLSYAKEFARENGIDYSGELKDEIEGLTDRLIKIATKERLTFSGYNASQMGKVLDNWSLLKDPHFKPANKRGEYLKRPPSPRVIKSILRHMILYPEDRKHRPWSVVLRYFNYTAENDKLNTFSNAVNDFTAEGIADEAAGLSLQLDASSFTVQDGYLVVRPVSAQGEAKAWDEVRVPLHPDAAILQGMLPERVKFWIRSSRNALPLYRALQSIELGRDLIFVGEQETGKSILAETISELLSGPEIDPQGIVFSTSKEDITFIPHVGEDGKKAGQSGYKPQRLPRAMDDGKGHGKILIMEETTQGRPGVIGLLNEVAERGELPVPFSRTTIKKQKGFAIIHTINPPTKDFDVNAFSDEFLERHSIFGFTPLQPAEAQGYISDASKIDGLQVHPRLVGEIVRDASGTAEMVNGHPKYKGMLGIEQYIRDLRAKDQSLFPRSPGTGTNMDFAMSIRNNYEFYKAYYGLSSQAVILRIFTELFTMDGPEEKVRGWHKVIKDAFIYAELWTDAAGKDAVDDYLMGEDVLVARLPMLRPAHTGDEELDRILTYIQENIRGTKFTEMIKSIIKRCAEMYDEDEWGGLSFVERIERIHTLKEIYQTMRAIFGARQEEIYEAGDWSDFELIKENIISNLYVKKDWPEEVLGEPAAEYTKEELIKRQDGIVPCGVLAIDDLILKLALFSGNREDAEKTARKLSESLKAQMAQIPDGIRHPVSAAAIGFLITLNNVKKDLALIAGAAAPVAKDLEEVARSVDLFLKESGLDGAMVLLEDEALNKWIAGISEKELDKGSAGRLKEILKRGFGNPELKALYHNILNLSVTDFDQANHRPWDALICEELLSYIWRLINAPPAASGIAERLALVEKRIADTKEKIGRIVTGVSGEAELKPAPAQGSPLEDLDVLKTADSRKVIGRDGDLDAPQGVSFSPDGKRLAVANGNNKNTVSIIDRATNQLIHTIGESGDIKIKLIDPSGVSFSPDGNRLAIANSNGKTVSIIDLTTNTLIHTIGEGADIPIEFHAPEGVLFTPDGKRLIITNESHNTVSVIGLNIKTLIHSIGKREDIPEELRSKDWDAEAALSGPTGISVTPDGRYLAIANYRNNTVSIIDLAKKVLACTIGEGADIDIKLGIPKSVSFSPDGRYLAIGFLGNNNAFIIDLTTKALIHTIGRSGDIKIAIGTPHNVSFTPDGKHLAISSSQDDTVSIIELIAKAPAAPASILNNLDAAKTADSMKVIGETGDIKVKLDNPNGIAFSLDGKRLAIADSSKNTVSIIDRTTNQVVYTIGESGDINIKLVNPSDVSFSPDGRLLAIANSDGNTVSIVDLTTNTLIHTIGKGGDIPIEVYVPEGVLFTPDGKRLIISNHTVHTVSIIDLNTKTLIHSIGKREDIPEALRSKDRDVEAVLSSPFGISVTPDGRYLAIANYRNNTVSIIDLVNKVLTRTIAEGADIPVEHLIPNSVSFTPDGRYLAIGSWGNGTVSIIDLIANKLIHTIGKDGDIKIAIGIPHRVSFTPDGRHLAISAQDGTVSIVELVAKGVAMAPPADLRSPLDDLDVVKTAVSMKVIGETGDIKVALITPSGVAFSPDGNQLAIVNYATKTVTITDLTKNLSMNIGGKRAGLSDPASASFSPDGKHLAIANNNINTVSIIDLTTYSLTQSIGKDKDIDVELKTPTGVSYSPDGKHVAISNFGTNSVSIIDLAASRVIRTIGASGDIKINLSGPHDVSYSSDGKKLAIANLQNKTVSITDLTGKTAAFTIGKGMDIDVELENPNGASFSPEGKYLAIADSTNGVFIIDLAAKARIHTISESGDIKAAVGTTFGVSFAPDGKRLVVSNLGNNAAYLIDLIAKEPVAPPVAAASLVKEIVVAPFPGGVFQGNKILNFPIALLQTGDTLYVAREGSHNVIAIDLKTGGLDTTKFNKGVFQDVETLKHPIAFLQTGDTLYVAGWQSHTVIAIDLKTGGLDTTKFNKGVFQDEKTLERPRALLQTGDTLYVAGSGNNTVIAIDLKTGGLDTTKFNKGVFQDVEILNYPIALHQTGDTLYVACEGSHTVIAIDLKTGGLDTTKFNKGVFQDDKNLNAPFALHQTGDTLYVADSGNNAIIAIDLKTGGLVEKPYKARIGMAGPAAPQTQATVAVATKELTTLRGELSYLESEHAALVRLIEIHGRIAAAKDEIARIEERIKPKERPALAPAPASPLDDLDVAKTAASKTVISKAGDIKAELVTPRGVSFSSDGKYQAIVNLKNHTVSILDRTTKELIHTIGKDGDIKVDIGDPHSVSFSPDGKHLAISDLGKNIVHIVDLAAKKPIHAIGRGGDIKIALKGPYGVSFSPDGRQLVIANGGKGTVSIIDLIAKGPAKVSSSAAKRSASSAPPAATSKELEALKNSLKSLEAEGAALERLAGIYSRLDSTRQELARLEEGISLEPASKPALTQKQPISEFDVTKLADIKITRIGASGDIKAALIAPRGVSFSPDGKQLAITSWSENAVSIIDLTTNQRIYLGKDDEIALHHPCSVSFSPDGKQLAVANDEAIGTVSLIDLTTKKIVRTIGKDKDINMPLNSPAGISFSPDGRQLAIANDLSISIIDLTAKLGHTIGIFGDIKLNLSDPTDVSFSPDGRFLAVANSVGNEVSIIDLTTNKLIRSITLTAANGVSFTPDGRYLAIVHNSHVAGQMYVSILDLASNKTVFTIGKDGDMVTESPLRISFAPDGRRLAISHLNDTVSIIDFIAVVPAAKASAAPGSPLADLDVVKTAGSRKTLGPSVDIAVPLDNPHGVSFSPDGTRLAVSNNDDDTVSIVDLTTNTLIHTIGEKGDIKVELSRPESVAFSPDGKLLAIANHKVDWASVKNLFKNDKGGSVSIIDLTTKKLIRTIGEDGDIKIKLGRTGDVSFSPDGTRLAIANADTVSMIGLTANNQSIRIIGKKGDIKAALKGPEGVSFTPDGTRLAISDRFDNTISIIDLTANKLIHTIGEKGDIKIGIKLDHPGSISFTPDGRHLAVSNEDNRTIPIIDLSANKISSIIGEFGSVWADLRDTHGISFSPDGKHIAVTYGDKNAVSILELAGQTRGAKKVIGRTGDVTAGLSYPHGVAFSSDGKQLAIANWKNDTVSIMDPATNDLIKAIDISSPRDVSFSPDGTQLAISNFEDDVVSIIDIVTKKDIHTISESGSIKAALKGPRGVSFSPDGKYLAIANHKGRSVSIIDLAAKKLMHTLREDGDVKIKVGFTDGISYSPDGKYLAIVNGNNNTIAIIDGATYAPIQTIGKEGDIQVELPALGGISFSPDGRYLAVSADPGKIVVIVDLMAKKIAHAIGEEGDIKTALDSLGGVAFTPDGKRIAVSDWRNDTVSMIDLIPNEAVKATPAPAAPSAPSEVSKELETLGDSLASLEAERAKLEKLAQICRRITDTKDGIARLEEGARGGVATVQGKAIPAPSAPTATAKSPLDNLDRKRTADTEKVLGAFKDPGDISFSPDGKLLAINSWSTDTIYIIDLTGNKLIRRTIGKDGDIKIELPGPAGVSFSPDGTRLAVTNLDNNSVSIIDLTVNKVIHTIGKGEDMDGIELFRPKHGSFSPDGKRLAVANINDTVSIIDLTTNTLIHTMGDADWCDIQIALSNPDGISFSPDGKRLAISNYKNDTVSIIDLVTNQLIKTIGKEKDVEAELTGPRGTSFTPDGRYLAIANTDNGTVCIIDLDANKVIHTIAKGSDIDIAIYRPLAASFTPDGRRLAISNDNNTVSLIDLIANGPAKASGAAAKISASTAPPAAASKELKALRASLASLEAESLKLEKALKVSDKAAAAKGATAPAPAATLTLAPAQRSPLAHLDLSKMVASRKVIGKSIAAFKDPQGAAFSYDGKQLAISDLELNTVSIVDLATNKLIHTIGKDKDIDTQLKSPRGVSFSPDGKLLAISNVLGNTVSIIDLATKKLIHTIGKNGDVEITLKKPEGVSFTPDGKRLAISSDDKNTVLIIDLTTKKLIHTIGKNGDIKVVLSSPKSVAFSPDGKHLAIMGWLKCSIINLTTKELIHTICWDGDIKIKLDFTTGVSFSPDGKRLAIAHFPPDHHQVLIIDLTTKKLIHTIGKYGDVKIALKRPEGVSFSSDGKELVISSISEEDTVSVINFSANGPAKASGTPSGVMPSAKVTPKPKPSLTGAGLDAVRARVREAVAAAAATSLGRATGIDAVLHQDVAMAVELYCEDMLPALEGGRYYEVRYNERVLDGSYIELMEEYISILNARFPSSEFKLVKSSLGGDRLFETKCYLKKGANLVGEGVINVSPEEGNMKDYLIRVVAMINITVASSSLTNTDSSEYERLARYVVSQYRSLSDSDLVLSGKPEEDMKLIKSLSITLPKTYKISPNDQPAKNAMLREFLKNA